MKNIIKQIIGIVPATLFCAVLGFTACTDNFESLNDNPNGLNPENIPLVMRFAQPQQSIYLNYLNRDYEYQLQQNLNADLYSGYLGTPNDFGGNNNNNTYVMNDGWNNQAFTTGMINILKPISQILDLTEETDYIAIAKIIRVAAIHRVSDMYGPLPYSKAMKGGTVVGYDSQEQLYKTFLEELTESVNALTTFVDANGDQPGRITFDVMCGQSHTRWIRFANTLRLRLAMRMVKVDPATAKKEAEAAVSQKYGVLTSADANIEVKDKGLTNPLRTIAVDYNDSSLGGSFESIMKGYDDPRLPEMALPVGWNGDLDIHGKDGKPLNKIGQYVGIRQGIPIDDKNNYKMYSIPKFDVKDADKLTTKYPLPIMKVAEAYFLRAEGVLRGWSMGGGTAQSLYEEGIKASFDEYGISADKYAAYIADDVKMAADYENPYDPEFSCPGVNKVTVKWNEAADNETKLQKIITQKWIAMFPEGQEAWSEFRRTGYPKLLPVADNRSKFIPKGEFIKRLPFTLNERNTNLEAVEEARTMLKGPDDPSTRLWWDVEGGNF